MDQPAAEAHMRTYWDSQDYNGCAVLALESYGAEVYSFLMARFPGKNVYADDAFSEFSEDLWRALPTFEWRCAMRSYCYKLAKSAAARVGRAPHNRNERRVPLSQSPAIEAAVDRARTSTAPYLQTAVKDGVAKLRESLSQDDRELLTLRIDRKLAWREIAFILSETSPDVSAEEMRKFETALRQRFSDIKKRIRRKAEQSGLLDARQPSSEPSGSV
jgi:RNA polymerase sigma-70 factor (ECF subfamily)